MVASFGGPPPSMVAATEEESEALNRSRKKVRKEGNVFTGDVLLKPRMEDWMEEDKLRTEQPNYKESLMRNIATSWCDLDEEEDGEPEAIKTGFDDMKEPTRGIKVDLRDPLCPNFVLEDAEKERLQRPFKRTLIVKMLGNSLNYNFMGKKFAQLWARAGKIRVFDLPNDFYLVKFQNQEDYDNTLTGGPWVIANSYLSVMRWRADFNPRQEVVDRVIAWVRLPDLPATHYDRKFLYNLGNAIGKAIKVDVPTAQRERGKFARLCVELDLTKPLVPKYSIEGQIQSIEYECMNLLCLHCGRFGHTKEACGDRKSSQKGKGEEVNEQRGREATKEGEIAPVDGRNTEESQWKVVQKPWRQRRFNTQGTTDRNNNRFKILSGGKEVEGLEKVPINTRSPSLGPLDQGLKKGERSVKQKGKAQQEGNGIWIRGERLGEESGASGARKTPEHVQQTQDSENRSWNGPTLQKGAVEKGHRSKAESSKPPDKRTEDVGDTGGMYLSEEEMEEGELREEDTSNWAY